MLAYITGLIGVWIFADGFASLWAYLPNKKETWLRNHSLRLVRCGFGIALIIIGGVQI